MDNEYEQVEIIKRQPKGIEAKATNLTLPGYLIPVIDEEARIKKITRSAVIAYLILCGLKAHVGEFILPGDNTIKQNYIKRGRTW